MRQAGRRRLAALALSAALALAPLSAAQPETLPPAEASIAAAGLEGASTGYIVADLDGGAVLASRRADEAFLPASTARSPPPSRRSRSWAASTASRRASGFPATGSIWWAAAIRCSPWRT